MWKGKKIRYDKELGKKKKNSERIENAHILRARQVSQILWFDPLGSVR